MRIAIQKGPLEYCGRIVYRREVQSFDFEPRQVSHCSVLVADLQLAFHAGTWHACQISGFHPNFEHEKGQLMLPVYSSGNLLLLDDIFGDGEKVQEVLEEVGSLRLEGSLTWPTLYDPRNGWVCIGEEHPQNGDNGVEFASGCIAVVNNYKLKALWLKPTILVS